MKLPIYKHILLYLLLIALVSSQSYFIKNPDINDVATEIQNNNLDIHSIIVYKDHHIIYERYFNGHERNELHITYHIVNTLYSTLIGISIEAGLINSVEDPIINYYPEYNSVIIDGRQRRISIKHLMMMTGGYQWSSEHNDNAISEFKQKNLLEYMFSLSLAFSPGTHFSQNSGGIFLLVNLLEKIWKKPIEKIIKEKIFNPLEITEYRFVKDETGITKGPYTLYLQSNDILKIGLLMAHNGTWNGNRIIQDKWIQQSVHDFLPLKPMFTEFIELKEKGLGYCWWIFDNMYAALGHSGQHLYVSQRESFVVVITGKTLFVTPAQLFIKYIKPVVSGTYYSH